MSSFKRFSVILSVFVTIGFQSFQVLAYELETFGSELHLIDDEGDSVILNFIGDDSTDSLARIIYDLGGLNDLQFVSSGEIRFRAAHESNPSLQRDFVFRDSGSFAFASGRGGSWSSVSDVRAKKDIRDFSPGLAEIERLNPVVFQYNGAVNLAPDDGRDYVGLIAQEVKDVLPILVDTSDEDLVDGEPVLVVDNSALTYVLINAVKEENGLISELDSKLNEIEESLGRVIEGKIQSNHVPPSNPNNIQGSAKQ